MSKLTDDLVSVLADTINKNNKEEKVAFFLNDTEAPTNISDWISTGSSMLDLAISNRPYGGLPVGRIAEITGLEQSGKSLVSAHILASTQKMGGVAILIDTENAVSLEFFEAIGVDINKLLYIQTEMVEDVFSTIELIIEKVRKSANKDTPVTIVVDSLAAASTKIEMSADYDKDGYATSKAIIISKALRKITNTIGRQNVTLVFTNQLRMKLNAMFGDPYTTSGGKALGFHSSVRIRLKKLSNIKRKENGVDRIIGITVRANITKNRIGPPLRSCNFDVYFDSGINDYASWLTALKDNNLVKRGGAWYTMNMVDEETGEIIPSPAGDESEEWKFQASTFISDLEHSPKLKEFVYKKICDSVIMAYSTESGVIDETLETEIDEGE